MNDQQKQLLQRARDAAEKAYAPYSRFRVGAAVLCGDEVYIGCNVENASSNLGMCAERVAISHAVAHVTNGGREIHSAQDLLPHAFRLPKGD